MPLLRLQLNGSLARSAQKTLLTDLASSVSKALEKPEGYTMVVLEPQTPIYFGGSPDPAAFFEVRSIGSISSDQAKAISSSVSDILRDQLQIDPQRIYSNFGSVERTMWGHNGQTFG